MDDESKNLLRALLSVMMEARTEDAKKTRKDEVILSENGLGAQDIGTILGKTPAAVAKAVQRAKSGKS